MSRLFLAGKDSGSLWMQPDILTQCKVRPLEETLGRPAILSDCFHAGPAKIPLSAIPQHYTPKLYAAQGREVCQRIGTTYPIDTFVTEHSLRRIGKKLRSRVLPMQVPAEQFAQIEEELFISSPEFTLLQLARSQTAIELAIEISKYVSVYAKNTDSSTGVAPRQQLTSIEKLTSFSIEVAGADGAPALAKALKYAIELAASPREIAIGMLFCLPPSMGGYGLGIRPMNQKIDTSSYYDDGKEHHRYCDLLFPELSINIEYDGRSSHERRAEMAADAVRHNELASLGITEFIVTKEQYSDLGALDAIALSIAGLCKIDIPPFTKEFKRNQMMLYTTLARSL